MNNLGRFGHHPNPAIDFEIESNIILDMEYNIKNNISEHPTFQERLTKALEFPIGVIEICILAKQKLKKIIR